MKKLICCIFALLLFHSDKAYNDIKYYVCVVFQDHLVYEEYMNGCYLEVVIRSFVTDSNIESVFVTRDINYVPETDFNR